MAKHIKLTITYDEKEMSDTYVFLGEILDEIVEMHGDFIVGPIKAEFVDV